MKNKIRIVNSYDLRVNLEFFHRNKRIQEINKQIKTQEDIIGGCQEYLSGTGRMDSINDRREAMDDITTAEARINQLKAEHKSLKTPKPARYALKPKTDFRFLKPGEVLKDSKPVNQTIEKSDDQILEHITEYGKAIRLYEDVSDSYRIWKEYNKTALMGDIPDILEEDEKYQLYINSLENRLFGLEEGLSLPREYFVAIIKSRSR